jgi:hypothetical protein
MLRRTRTTKKLARRIDLQYFSRPHPLRRWRFWLSVVVPALALGWLLTQRAHGGQRIYSSGRLSRSHAVFTQQCGLCHVARAGTFFKEISDQACLTCHDGPVHHSSQTFTPSCSSCHVEHKGVQRLLATSDASCTQCHSRLRTREGQPHYAVSIDGFDRGHPDFSPLGKGKIDSGQVKLNHYLHLQPGLVGPSNQRVQMICDDCHRTANADGDWPYRAPAQNVSVEPAPIRTIERGAYMTPIQYAKHCAACHTLQFDRRFGNEQVPHDQPNVIHTFLARRFEEYVAEHPTVVHEIEPPNRQLPERDRVLRMARDRSEWVRFRVEDAEWVLWAKTCKQCHVLEFGTGALPDVAKSNITARWLLHAEFGHHAHRMMSCAACHARTTESHDTADILLPGIAVCQQCHRQDGSSRDVAEGRCFECHKYHDWSRAKRTNGRFSIPELRGTAQLTLPQEQPPISH